MRFMQTGLVALLMVVCSPQLLAADELRENLRSSVFAGASDALKHANDQSASVLAPETYRAAANQYRKAEEAFEDGEDMVKVRALLAGAIGQFTEAAVRAEGVGLVVKDAFEARADALAADARTRAPDLWRKADVALYEAASRAEVGRQSRVENYATRAERFFRDAELSAIEVALFTEIEAAIAAAKRLDADDWAPISYGKAVELLAQARSELSSNRYDTDRPRTLATQSLHHARHAAYVAKLADDIDDNDTSLEEVLLAWEQEIERFAATQNLPVYFDEGPTQAIDAFIALHAELKQRLALSEQALNSSHQRALILEEELSMVQADLEGQELAQARLNKRMAEQQAREDKITQIETMFGPSEALVLRAQNQLIIRLIGLGFASGSASIEPHHEPLLERVQQALAAFPDAPITIEGHTDSHGVDDKNLTLSIARAEAVVNYLLENTEISALQLSAVGHGETKPIANNETNEGRLRNRRIDIVIYP